MKRIETFKKQVEIMTEDIKEASSVLALISEEGSKEVRVVYGLSADESSCQEISTGIILALNQIKNLNKEVFTKIVQSLKEHLEELEME